MDALDLDVEERVRVEPSPMRSRTSRASRSLFSRFTRAKASWCRIVGERLEVAQRLDVVEEAVADRVADERVSSGCTASASAAE